MYKKTLNFVLKNIARRKGFPFRMISLWCLLCFRFELIYDKNSSRSSNGEGGKNVKSCFIYSPLWIKFYRSRVVEAGVKTLAAAAFFWVHKEPDYPAATYSVSALDMHGVDSSLRSLGRKHRSCNYQRIFVEFN